MTIKHWKFLLPLSLLHLLLLFFRIDRKNLWLDEVMSLNAARSTWSQMWGFFTLLPEQHPLYYLLLRGWLAFGTSELVLRSLSALFALASLWAIFYLAREIFDETVAKVAAVLLCFSPFYLYYGQEARMYSLLGFLTILSSLLLLRWLGSGRRGLLIAYGVIALLGAYTHFFFLFVLAAHLGFLLLRDRSLTPAVTRLVMVLGLVGVAYLPWAFLILQGSPESQDWKGPAHVVLGIPYTLLRFSLGYSELAPNYQWKERVPELVRENVGLLALAILCFGTLALVGLRTVLRRRGEGLLVVSGAVIPAALAVLGSVAVILVGERYLLVSFPFYLLLLAVGMVALVRQGGRGRMVGLALILLYLLLTANSLRSYYFDPTFGNEQWAEVAAHLRANAGPDDLIIVHRGYAVGSLRYYYSENTQQRLFRSDQVRPEDLRTADRLWLVLRNPSDADEYVATMQNDYRIESNQLFPKQSGIRVLLMVRSPLAGERARPDPTRAGEQRTGKWAPPARPALRRSLT